jgi:uncharacterized membrane protein
VCVLFAFLVAFAMPNRYLLGPPRLGAIAGATLLGLFGLSAAGNVKGVPRSVHNAVTIAVVAIVGVLNILTMIDLIHLIVYEPKIVDAHRLLGSSVVVWVENVLTFALLYWLLDGGGPDARIASDTWRADFMFPTPVREADVSPDGRPNFMDYAFLAFSTATAFSPTDTSPLTTRARVMMMIEAAVSLLTIAITAARAVNILS